MVSSILDRQWDVIVVGSGLGGGTLGRRLAERGVSVLFVERGPRVASTVTEGDAPDDPEARLRHGYWPTRIRADVDGHETNDYGSVGSCVGGSSTFYAATLERPERHDIDDSADRPHPTGGWPVGFDTFRPYFEQAEQLFHVSGDPDPLSREVSSPLFPPPARPAGDQALFERLRSRGLHPYHLHMGLRFVSGCNMCFGRPCARQCKMDGRSAGVEPAIATGNAALLDMCEVVALRGTRSRITHVEAVRDGQRLTLRAKHFVLAAGGFGSPRLLLASASSEWPNGCANSSGMVGRNLMLHLLESVAIWPGRKLRFDLPTKTIALRDLYYHDGKRYGALQAAGLDAGYGYLTSHLKDLFDTSPLGFFRPLRPLANIAAYITTKLLGTAKIFRVIFEDLPYPDNRVLFDPADPERIHFQYRVPEELKQRRRSFHAELRRRLKGQPSLPLNNNVAFDMPHTCGTLRFGHDPRTSVLDPDCRAHDIDNLYVADASFMPTSMGINPGLTVVANALRVADAVWARMARSERTVA